VNLVENNTILNKLGLRRHILSVHSHKLDIIQHDKLLLLGHNNLSFGFGHPRNKSTLAVLSVHHHVSFQLPVLFKLFPTRLTLFGQLFGLFHGPNFGGQMDPRVHFEIVFALKLCRALIAPKVPIVFVHKHVTSQLSLHIKTFWTVRTAKVPRYDVMMLLLMAFTIVQIIGRIIALTAVGVANVLVIVDDMMVQGLTVGADKLWTVRAAVDLLG
jgi:hypothetical protein